MILFLQKSTGRILMTIDGASHTEDHLRGWFESTNIPKDDVERLIIGEVVKADGQKEMHNDHLMPLAEEIEKMPANLRHERKLLQSPSGQAKLVFDKKFQTSDPHTHPFNRVSTPPLESLPAPVRQENLDVQSSYTSRKPSSPKKRQS